MDIAEILGRKAQDQQEKLDKEYSNNIRALKALKKAIKLRKEIGAIARWCEADEVGRYDLDTLINNLAAMNDPTLPTCKLLR